MLWRCSFPFLCSLPFLQVLVLQEQSLLIKVRKMENVSGETTRKDGGVLEKYEGKEWAANIIEQRECKREINEEFVMVCRKFLCSGVCVCRIKWCVCGKWMHD